jgi:hypothetical protein
VLLFLAGIVKVGEISLLKWQLMKQNQVCQSMEVKNVFQKCFVENSLDCHFCR